MVRSQRWVAAVCLVLFLGTAGWLAWPDAARWNYEPQSGDILFQSLPRMPLVNAIEGATDSPWSHCGIVARENGRWMVYEAYRVVECTPLDEWLDRSRGRRFAVYRLKPEYRRHIPAMISHARSMLGRPYDARYRLDDERIYCSELVWKAYRQACGDELGHTVALGSLHWEPYRETIEHYEGGPPPLDRQMITPRGLSEAPQLQRVLESP